MSRFHTQKAYGQRIVKLFADCYRISWVVDRYYSGSRLRWPTESSRVTDDRGAERFCKKHGLTVPA
jgi:hypothetical protein